MTKNIGKRDRLFRALAALGLAICSGFAPLSELVRFAVFAPMAGYLLFTALTGTCLGYSLMGRSTCPVESRR